MATKRRYSEQRRKELSATTAEIFNVGTFDVDLLESLKLKAINKTDSDESKEHLDLLLSKFDNSSLVGVLRNYLSLNSGSDRYVRYLNDANVFYRMLDDDLGEDEMACAINIVPVRKRAITGKGTISDACNSVVLNVIERSYDDDGKLYRSHKLKIADLYDNNNCNFKRKDVARFHDETITRNAKLNDYGFIHERGIVPYNDNIVSKVLESSDSAGSLVFEVDSDAYSALLKRYKKLAKIMLLIGEITTVLFHDGRQESSGYRNYINSLRGFTKGSESDDYVELLIKVCRVFNDIDKKSLKYVYRLFSENYMYIESFEQFERLCVVADEFSGSVRSIFK